MDGAEILAAVSEAAYLLSRFCPPAWAGWKLGRVWERCVCRIVGASGLPLTQGPGSLTLFGGRSASGVNHEIDTGGAKNWWTLMVESKATPPSGVSKEDLCCFDRKTFDLYVARRSSGELGPHHRMLIAAAPLGDDLRKYCYLYGIIATDPELALLPMLLRIASRPAADMYFPAGILNELVRLGEIACASMEQRYAPDGPNHLRFDLSALRRRDLDDLLWLQRNATDDLMELVDKEAPDYFEEQAELLVERLSLRQMCGPARL